MKIRLTSANTFRWSRKKGIHDRYYVSRNVRQKEAPCLKSYCRNTSQLGGRVMNNRYRTKSRKKKSGWLNAAGNPVNCGHSPLVHETIIYSARQSHDKDRRRFVEGSPLNFPGVCHQSPSGSTFASSKLGLRPATSFSAAVRLFRGGERGRSSTTNLTTHLAA